LEVLRNTQNYLEKSEYTVNQILLILNGLNEAIGPNEPIGLNEPNGHKEWIGPNKRTGPNELIGLNYSEKSELTKYS